MELRIRSIIWNEVARIQIPAARAGMIESIASVMARYFRSDTSARIPPAIPPHRTLRAASFVVGPRGTPISIPPKIDEGKLRSTKVGFGRASAPRRGRWSQREQARLKELYGLRDDNAIARELKRPVASIRRMAEKLFSGPVRTGPWTASEVGELRRYLGATTPEVIGRILGRTPEEVSERIFELGRIQKGGAFGREELVEFKRIYGTRTDEDLSRVFGRSPEEIRVLAKELALAKDKAFVRKLAGEAATRMPRWREEELDYLRRDYPSCSNLELARTLGRSVKSVVSKAHHLGLKKSSERLRSMGRENVSLRYQNQD
jgi:hypothetical protein